MDKDRTSNTDLSSLPLKQRFVTGRLREIRPGALEFEIEGDDGPARWARVADMDRPDERCEPGKTYTLFLLRPIQHDTRYWHASRLLASDENHPWFTHPWHPRDGDLPILTGTAIDYLDDYAVFVRLDDWPVDGFLHRDEIPNHDGAAIQDLVDLGDRLPVCVTETDTERLNLRLSVRRVVARMDEELRDAQWHEAFDQEPVRPIEAPHYALETGQRVAVLATDLSFATHLTQWLRLLGYRAQRLRSPQHLDSVLHAANRPTHLVCTPEAWPTNAQAAGALSSYLRQHRVQTLWLSSNPDYPLPFEAPATPLPLDLFRLRAWLKAPDTPPPHSGTDRFTTHDDAPQAERIRCLADQHLQALCEEIESVEAAMLVRRNREAVFEIRAHHGLGGSADDRKTVEKHIAQTLIGDSITRAIELLWHKAQSGRLQMLFPKQARQVLCLPIRIAQPRCLGAARPEDTTEEAPVDDNRALALFLSGNFKQSEGKTVRQLPLHARLQPYLRGIEALVQAYELARHNEDLMALAELGRNEGAYLHEVGQLALGLFAFVQHHASAGPGEIAPADWHRLLRDLDRLVRFTHKDLKDISHLTPRPTSIRELLARQAERLASRFARAGCQLVVECVDAPLTVQATPLFLQHTIGNLLDNALYFAKQRETGRVILRARLADAADGQPQNPQRPLWIEVEDNGPGIRTSSVEHLFRPRFSEKPDGTGMGLANARGYVESQGGRLLLDERIRWRCTRFRIELPVQLTPRDLANRSAA